MNNTSNPFLVAIIFLLFTLPLFSQKKSRKKVSYQNIELPAHTLRMKMDDFFVRFAGEVELAADSIISLSSEPAERKQALRWKLYAIPAAQRSAMQRDPFGSLIDGAVLCIQMADFFSTGNGKDAFGEHQRIAIHSSENLIKEIRQIAQALSKNRNTNEGEMVLRQYAKDHPIQTIYFVRENAHYLFGAYIKAEKMGFKKIAKELTADMEDLMNRMNVYTENMPKQIRWQSELMMAELAEEMKREGTFDSLTNQVIAKTDTMVAIYFEKMNDMINHSLATVDSQRVIITKDIGLERAIVLETINRERLETMAELKRERATILNFVSAERAMIFNEMDSLTTDKIELSLQGANKLATQGIDASLAGADDLLDRFFRKIYMLFGVLFIGGIVFVFLVRVIWKTKGNVP
ncbi:MAG: hypothetical protein ACI9UO_003103 [Nitrospinales bacterium]|jgi:hypothetical protein